MRRSPRRTRRRRRSHVTRRRRVGRPSATTDRLPPAVVGTNREVVPVTGEGRKPTHATARDTTSLTARDGDGRLATAGANPKGSPDPQGGQRA